MLLGFKRLAYTKIVQSSAMEVYFHIAECSLSYTKVYKNSVRLKPLGCVIRRAKGLLMG